jgi:CheY-like chemotaxis protein
MIDAVVNTIHPLAAKKGNQLLVECDPNLGSMTADLTKVRQSLFNLLSNSSKFTENGHIWLHASRFQSGGTDWCEFRVTDTGIGIPEEKQLGVFEPFSQVDKGRSRKYGGTGLGLAITKRFCELMGGEITLTSAPGKGSEFRICLPATTSDNAERDTATAPTGEHHNTVLIIDDDPAAQDLLRRFMEREGFHPVSALSGPHALQLVKEVHPVAITLDVMMPGMDGWVVLSSLKNDPETADIPVIIVSIVDDKNLGYALGAAEYLTKPIDRERFSKVLDRYRCIAGDCPVLLVEDDPAVRQTLRSVLERHGWRVSEAGNGAIALEMMANEAPELILLDLIMPEMDGFEFAEHLRKNEQWRSIPVIIVTSKDLTTEEISRLNGNVERILRKESYAYSDLLGEIHRIAAYSGRLRGKERD